MNSDQRGRRHEPRNQRPHSARQISPPGARREALGRARHALVEWLAHLIVVAGLLLGFHAIEVLLRVLGQQDRLLFGRVPLTYLFDAGDAALVIGFLIYGVYSVLNAYRSYSHGRIR